MRKTRQTAWIAILALLVSCADEPEAARYSVAEYRANKALRKEVFARCIKDPGTLGNTADCINAREAERLESHGSLRDAAPIGLDSKKR